MTYECSPNIAVYVRDIDAALAFYRDTLGFEQIETRERWIELQSGPNNLFLMEATDIEGAVHELFVDDLEAAHRDLVEQGCEVLRWEGKGGDCYIRDPNGLLFNIWERQKEL